MMCCGNAASRMAFLVNLLDYVLALVQRDGNQTPHAGQVSGEDDAENLYPI